MRRCSHGHHSWRRSRQASPKASAISRVGRLRRSAKRVCRTTPERTRQRITLSRRRLGMFDSGLGGLTVLRAVRSLDDAVDVFYFADTAHVPYGDRKLVEVSGFARRIIARLLEHDPSAILIACGTTCSAFDALGWPSIGIPLFGLVAAGAREA